MSYHSIVIPKYHHAYMFPNTIMKWHMMDHATSNLLVLHPITTRCCTMPPNSTPSSHLISANVMFLPKPNTHTLHFQRNVTTIATHTTSLTPLLPSIVSRWISHLRMESFEWLGVNKTRRTRGRISQHWWWSKSISLSWIHVHGERKQR